MIIDALVANPSNQAKRSSVRFIVDTGAGMTALPSGVARKLGLRKVATAEVALADGRVIPVDLAYVYINIHGEHVFALIACGGCDMPLLGFDILSLLGLQLDPANKKCFRPVRRLRVLRIVWKRMWGRDWLDP